MLILLPPSEGKKTPESGKQLHLKKLVAGEELGEVRTLALAHHPTLDLTRCLPAHQIYSGVLYQGLDWHSLSATAKSHGENSVLIISALFGLVGINDHIPTYKAKMKNSLWKEAVGGFLVKRGDDLIIDARSSTYQGVWTPPPGKTVAVRVFQIKGGKKSVITHMSKKYRGELVRLLLQKKAPTTPEELYAIAKIGFSCDLIPAKKNDPWFLDLLIQIP